MSNIRIIIADDHDIVRAGTKNIIELDNGCTVVAEASDGEELLQLLHTTPCDLILLDLSMPKMDGLKALEEIHVAYPDLKVLILSMLKDNEHFKRALSRGASGYILKEEACQHLVGGIKAVMAGKKYVSPNVSILLTDRFLRSMDEVDDPCEEILTRRELQVLKLVAQGMANKNIADKLKISIRTVENHRFNLTDKLGIKSTAGLVKYAISKGLD